MHVLSQITGDLFNLTLRIDPDQCNFLFNVYILPLIRNIWSILPMIIQGISGTSQEVIKSSWAATPETDNHTSY